MIAPQSGFLRAAAPEHLTEEAGPEQCGELRIAWQQDRMRCVPGASAQGTPVHGTVLPDQVAGRCGMRLEKALVDQGGGALVLRRLATPASARRAEVEPPA
ncbi:hypothetical protein [Streptomyces sp. NPDC014676]|uniref:hypothetical protein n=1 Tax=Streptomyces sp. NPDC014676 TaxID=3364879 RepID=UPI0037031C10